MWDQLPELILTQIFDYLDRTDRASVSQVCRSWNRTLSSPVLWRSVTVLIDRDLRGDFPLAGELAAKYGQHMRNLELAFSRPYISPRQVRIRRNIQAEAGADFLAIIRAKDIQLRQLTLTNWVFGYKWGNRGILLSALANFLRTQRSLEILSLLNADFGVTDVLRLLGTVAKGSGEHLVSLDLRGAFREWQAPHDNPKYLRLLGRFHALTLLKLDYPALSNYALDALASGASKTLKYLYISVRDSDSRQHMVADAAWRNLVLACPDLTVSYTIVNISHYEDMYYLLLPSVPLAKFYMFSGHVWDQSRSRNFRNTIGLIITQYTNTLVEVMLQLRNNRESLDDLLVSMLIRCKRLMRLQYDGIIRSLETLREICQLQAERKTHFRTIHVKPRNVNIQNRAILNDINYRYDRKMHEQGVDFRIEDITSILFFY
ncbi:PREDICTED: F-box only protein 39-like isoform X1 [Trachymyrmex cornetzi]|uniref:F-box only protein 39 n=1 Tax=Trachymyrmex cornetzi TaxID=471704 RepID=A0A195DI75_9HYME|nr:PREDICTED: F-box only protein 39-like isoform X1 [Trachymyrmex cornetzi]KYN12593.1 F-box only protein 39 [Trachymyrmex cornetzi]